MGLLGGTNGAAVVGGVVVGSFGVVQVVGAPDGDQVLMSVARTSATARSKHHPPFLFSSSPLGAGREAVLRSAPITSVWQADSPRSDTWPSIVVNGFP